MNLSSFPFNQNREIFHYGFQSFIKPLNKIEPRLDGISKFKMQKKALWNFADQKHLKATKALKIFIYSSHLIQVVRESYRLVYPAVIRYIFIRFRWIIYRTDVLLCSWKNICNQIMFWRISLFLEVTQTMHWWLQFLFLLACDWFSEYLIFWL